MYSEEAESLIKMALTLVIVMMTIALALGAYSIARKSFDNIATQVDTTVAKEETSTIEEDDSFEKAIAEIERQQALEEERKLQEQREAEAASREAERKEREELRHKAVEEACIYLHKGINTVGVIACAMSIACAIAYLAVYVCFARKTLLYYEEGRKFERFELAAKKYGSRSLWSFAIACLSCALAFL